MKGRVRRVESHELRTPLTWVLTPGILRDRDDLPDSVRTHLDVIHRNAGSLQLLMSGLLDVAQAREGGLELHCEDADLAALVRDGLDNPDPRPVTQASSWSRASPTLLSLTSTAPRIRQVVDNSRLQRRQVHRARWVGECSCGATATTR